MNDYQLTQTAAYYIVYIDRFLRNAKWSFLNEFTDLGMQCTMLHFVCSHSCSREKVDNNFNQSEMKNSLFSFAHTSFELTYSL